VKETTHALLLGYLKQAVVSDNDELVLQIIDQFVEDKSEQEVAKARVEVAERIENILSHTAIDSRAWDFHKHDLEGLCQQLRK